MNPEKYKHLLEHKKKLMKPEQLVNFAEEDELYNVLDFLEEAGRQRRREIWERLLGENATRFEVEHLVPPVGVNPPFVIRPSELKKLWQRKAPQHFLLPLESLKTDQRPRYRVILKIVETRNKKIKPFRKSRRALIGQYY